MIVSAPQPIQSEAGKKFRTHANYLRAFSWLTWQGRPLDGLEVGLKRLAGRVEGLPSFARLSRSRRTDIGQVGRSLRNAWGTEALLMLGEKFAADEVLNLVNAWGVIQMYYVLYHATQALAVASGASRPDSHRTTRNTFNDRWVRKPIDLPPWSLGIDHDGFRNADPDVTIDVHALRGFRPDSCWALAGKAIRTTRKKLVREKKAKLRQEKQKEIGKQWRETEKTRLAKGWKARKAPRSSKPQLSDEEKVNASKQVGAVGLINYLWRLRVGANYEDADVFTEGPTNEVESLEVYKALCCLGAGSLLIHELYVRQLIGKAELSKLADEWLTKVSKDKKTPLAIRRKLWAL